MSKVLPKFVRLRTQFSDHDASKYGLSCKDVSRTSQSEKDMFNPNNVMKLYRRTQDKSVFMKRRGIFADISGMSQMNSFADVMAQMDSINSLFMTLPALEREQFGNNPMRFLDFANDPANLKWLADRGFVEFSNSDETKLVVPPEQNSDSGSSESAGTPEK